jgi:hypothetical protein
MYNEFIVDSIQPVIDAGLVRFVAVNEQICDEVKLEPPPGHRLEHVSVRFESRGEKASLPVTSCTTPGK